MSRTTVAMTPKAEKAYIRAQRAQEELAEAQAHLVNLEIDERIAAEDKAEDELQRMVADEQPRALPVRHDPPKPARTLPAWWPEAAVAVLFIAGSLLILWFTLFLTGSL